MHSANVALFGNYMAGFVNADGSDGGNVTIDSATVEPHPMLAHPNHR